MFPSLVYDETWWPILNVSLSCKPTIYWRILFRSGGHPIYFICLKKIGVLVVPSCLYWGLPYGDNSSSNYDAYESTNIWTIMIDKKRGRTGGVSLCTQTEDWYLCTDGSMVYLHDQITQTSSLANMPVQTTPPGTRFAALLDSLFPRDFYILEFSEKVYSSMLIMFYLTKKFLLEWQLFPVQLLYG